MEKMEKGRTPRRRRRRRSSGAQRAAVAVLALALVAAPAQARRPAPIEHVFVVVLENKGAKETFGSGSEAPYLAKKLRRKGVYLPHYFATAHPSLPNYIALVSGQAPNADTQQNCRLFTPFAPATAVADGQFAGTGCVYPSTVPNLTGQLDAAGRTWKGYMEDMGTSCRHPAIGTADTTQAARYGDQYATRHNPFVYFRSIVDSPACAANVVDLGALRTDLARWATTPSYSMIVPNLCNSGHDAPCVDGRPGGLKSAGRWLAQNIPPILRSPGYRYHGLLVVTFDEAEAGGGRGDSRGCCGELAGPNVGLAGGTGKGGGRTGAVLVSPCIEPGTRNRRRYNHYSLLRSVERLFGLRYLGYAAAPGLSSFGPSVFTGRGQRGCR